MSAVSSILTPILNPGGACNCVGTDPSHIAPDWGCVLQTFQIVMNDFVVIATFLIVLYIAYAGFMMILSPTNPEMRSRGRKRIFNAIIGLAIVLGAFLIVNSVMGVFYNGVFGSWNSILGSNGNDNCIVEKEPAALPGINGASNAAGSGTPDAPGGTVPTSNNYSGPVNVNSAVQCLDQRALSKSQGLCATFVKNALQCGGVAYQSCDAKNCGSYLKGAGYNSIANGSVSGGVGGFTPQTGDVVIFQPSSGNPHQGGHIEMFDGHQWVSDFKQSTILPNSSTAVTDAHYTTYTVYRLGGGGG